MRYVLFLLLTSLTANACSFCDSYTQQPPLRTRMDEAKVVVQGTLRNPKPNADGNGGTTELVVKCVLKGGKAVKLPDVIVIPSYIPVVGDTPPDFIVLLDMNKDGTLDAFSGVPSANGVDKYLRAVIELPATKPTERIKFYFDQLQHENEAIQADALGEFAHASDAEVTAAAKAYDRVKLRKWLGQPDKPATNKSLYAVLLGHCGTPDDAAFLNRELDRLVKVDRNGNDVGAYLTALTMLDPARGWPRIQTIMGEPKNGFTLKYAALRSARYFQANRLKASRDEVLKAMKIGLGDPDYCDLVIGDLRRWEYWDFSKEIFANYAKPAFEAKIIKRSVIAYAFFCAEDEGEAFLKLANASDPKLVKLVSENLDVLKK